MDYFELLGLPRTFALDNALLEQRYLELSRDSHPDRMVGRPANARARAVSQSMYINEAHRTLKRELSRAEHLLALEGVEIGPNEAVDPQLLAEMLEMRERLSELRATGNAEQLENLEDSGRDLQRQERVRLGELFAKAESAGTADVTQAWQAVKSQIIRLRYLARYLEAFEDDFDAEPMT